jgi:hypothetical protein
MRSLDGRQRKRLSSLSVYVSRTFIIFFSTSVSIFLQLFFLSYIESNRQVGRVCKKYNEARKL